MTYGGGSHDPFGGDPFAAPGAQPGYTPSAPQQGYNPSPPPQGFGAPGWNPQPPPDKSGTLATLSIVFAFVFAPAGAALGHVALSQINRTRGPGRERAIIGLVLSYLVIVLAIIALVWWLVSDGSSGNTSTAPLSTAVTHPSPPPRPSTTVITAPPVGRPTVSVSELQVGDCIEVQREMVDKDHPEGGYIVTIYRTACRVADGVVQVKQILPSETCQTRVWLANTPQNTIYACIDDFKG
jgi:Domain of unknown function (DUF4190)